MNDLVLRTRLDVLSKNLLQVQNIADSVREGRLHLVNLHDLLSDVQFSLIKLQGTINSALHELKTAMHLKSWENVEKVYHKIRAVDDRFEEITSQIGSKAQGVITSMQERAVEIRTDLLGKTLDSEVATKAAKCSARIREIDERLVKKAREACRKSNKEAAQVLMREAWKDYTDNVYKQSQPVFGEYVDFLGGLALRDSGYVERFCQMADELINKVDSVPEVTWESLTIPWHREYVSAALTRMIRLGYPEWSIWTLPLTAHEFGHVVECKNAELIKFIDDQVARGQSQSHLYDYLADAFATYTMGPAYACAAILLRFDPSSAHVDSDESPAPIKRVHVVFSMLMHLNDKESSTQPYAGIVEILRTEWNAALLQAAEISALDDETTKRLDECVAFMWNFLDPNRRLNPPNSVRIREWTSKLLEQQGNTIEVYGTEELRDVLNAAWACRVENPAEADAIKGAAINLWNSIESKKEIRKGKPTD